MTKSPNPEIIVTELDDELVLLNPRTQAMFTLNGTGKLIWQHLGKNTAEEIAVKITETFEVDFTTATTDTNALLESLEKSGLLV
jgi:hypothetical protein